MVDDIQKIYTIGYTLFHTTSGVNIDSLFDTLRKYHITHLVDVRSVPYSKQYPQCNSDALKMCGKRYNIPYIHVPELGAKSSPEQDVFSKASDIFFTDIFPISKSNRPEKTELQACDEIVDFYKFRTDVYFSDGLKRIEMAYDKGFTIALMCSEKDPMNCHRYFLVSKGLEQKYSSWLKVEHIVHNQSGNISTITNKELDKKLVETVLNRTEVKKLDILSSSIFGDAIIENYFGETQQDKIDDFCDRYWNLMHGWKKHSVTNNNIEDYDNFI